MSHFERLRKAKTITEFAPLLGFTPSSLAYILYKLRPETLYTAFEIPKKAGGVRKIHAPKQPLKLLQRRLTGLLTVCLREIETKYPIRKSVSHGFHEDRSIVTNAINHRKRRYVLNVDIADFFGSINFGRVRGYFIADTEFQLDPAVATLIAQIACHNNALPQGSPCSPILSNLIGAILDRRLIALAKHYRCTYTRYADDLTFSTNARQFPRLLASRKILQRQEWRIGRALKREISEAGFSLNPTKTRMQIIGSRQTTTGLVVNEKVNVSQKYYRDTRSMCHALFRTGSYHRPDGAKPLSNLAPLEGRLAFIHGIKGRHDRSDKVNKEIGFFAPRAPIELYQRFLLYKYCVANPIPTLITEGRSDTIYLATAIKALAPLVPTLAVLKDGKPTPNVTFLRHSENNGELLHLGGGTGGISQFIHLSKNQKKLYPHSPLKAPVIIVTDNDEGASCVFKAAKAAYGVTIGLASSLPYYYLGNNFYLIKTPVSSAPKGDSCIEDLFPASVLGAKIDGKSFDKNKLHGDHTSYGKVIFADKIIRPHASKIDFSGFLPLLNGIVGAAAHHASILPTPVSTVATKSP